MPFKIFLPEANCWAYDVTHGHIDGFGWPEELNGAKYQ